MIIIHKIKVNDIQGPNLVNGLAEHIPITHKLRTKELNSTLHISHFIVKLIGVICCGLDGHSDKGPANYSEHLIA